MVDIQSKLKEIVKELQTHEETADYTLLYAGICGFQTYNLHAKDTDIHVKCFVMPNYSEVYEHKIISKEIKLPQGKVDIKDIRLLPELIIKLNPSYLEAFSTDYFLVLNEQAAKLFYKLREKIEDYIISNKKRFSQTISSIIYDSNVSRQTMNKLDAAWRLLIALKNNNYKQGLADNVFLRPYKMGYASVWINIRQQNDEIQAMPIQEVNNFEFDSWLKKQVQLTVAYSIYQDLKETFEF